MRITEFLTSSNFNRQVHENRTDMVKYNDQISSGKKVTKASDNTVAFLTSKLFENQLRKNEQYQKNAGAGLSRSRRVQDTLDRMNDLMITAKTLVTSGATDSNSEAERQQISSQLASLKEEIIELANVKFNDVYLFGGTQTIEPPFSDDGTGGVAMKSTPKPLTIRIGDGTLIETSVTGQDLRQTEGGDLFDILQTTIDALADNDGEEIRSSVDRMDKLVTHITGLSTRIANNINRLDFAYEWLEEQIISDSGEISRYTDADIIESMLNFTKAQTAYESVLAAQSRIMQTSLLAFLR